MVLLLTLSGCSGLWGTEQAEKRVETARGVGETRLFEMAARYPLEWIDDDVVVFLTWVGTATVDLRAGTVTEKRDPSLMSPNPLPERAPSRKLPPGKHFGPWQVSSDSRVLYADSSGDVSCGAMLVSPDGTKLACHYIVTDRMAETSKGAAAVVRLR
jgi:hypothetical protein